MSAMASQITQRFVQVQIKENIKVSRHWPLCGVITGQFPVQRIGNAENFSIWWRHHASPRERDGIRTIINWSLRPGDAYMSATRVIIGLDNGYAYYYRLLTWVNFDSTMFK